MGIIGGMGREMCRHRSGRRFACYRWLRQWARGRACLAHVKGYGSGPAGCPAGALPFAFASGPSAPQARARRPSGVWGTGGNSESRLSEGRKSPFRGQRRVSELRKSRLSEAPRWLSDTERRVSEGRSWQGHMLYAIRFRTFLNDYELAGVEQPIDCCVGHFRPDTQRSVQLL